jgi:hypothetical protein
MRGWIVPALLAMAASAWAQEDPVPRRREWLSAHQSSDGGWSGHGFRSHCEGGRCDGEGTWDSEVGSTGLALLAFLGFGETHRTPRYGNVVERGSARLMEIQDGDGCFGVRYPERFVADHAMATLAMAELYGLAQSPRFLPSAKQAVAFLLSQRGTDGGWRAGDRLCDSDAVTTAWAVMALRSARAAGIEVEDEVQRGVVVFLDGLTDPDTGWARLHRSDPEPSDRATAAVVLARIHCGAAREDEAILKVEERLSRALWEPESPVDPEYWYLGTRACFQMGGDAWKRWNESMKKVIIDSQVFEKESCRWGSWDPVPGPSAEMGRVATTALGVLCLQVYYRYARVFGSKDPPPRRSPPMSARRSNRAAALDLDFPEPRTGFLR